MVNTAEVIVYGSLKYGIDAHKEQAILTGNEKIDVARVSNLIVLLVEDGKVPVDNWESFIGINGVTIDFAKEVIDDVNGTKVDV